MRNVVAVVAVFALTLMGLVLTPLAAEAAPVGDNTITGTVTDYNNQPVYFARVVVHTSTGSSVAGTTTDTSGNYSIGSLTSGSYLVSASALGENVVGQYYANSQTVAGATTISLTGDNIAHIDFQLAKGAIANGTVTNTIGSPLEVGVKATPDHGDLSDAWGTGMDGSFTIPGLNPDTYAFTASDYDGFFTPVTKHAAAALATPVTVNFVLTPTMPDFSKFTPNQPAISGPTTVEAGKTYTWKLSDLNPSDVYVILYPNPVFLGAASPVGSAATITLTIPAGTPAGQHEFTYSSEYIGEGAVITRSAFPLTVTRPAVAVTTPAAPGPKLAATGSDVMLPLGVALLLLIAGVSVLRFHRRRESTR